MEIKLLEMPKPSSDHPVLRAAKLWRDRCLRRDGSVFTDRNLWTSENVGYLVKYYAEDLDKGKGNFLDNLENQLAITPKITKQLAAEILWVMYLFIMPNRMGSRTKLYQIRRVWEWSNEPLPHAPDALGKTLEYGAGNPGTAYSTLRWLELVFFIRMMDAWKLLSASQREARLADPWDFSQWIERQDETKNRLLRHIILYLLFPDYFEPFASRETEEEDCVFVRKRIR